MNRPESFIDAIPVAAALVEVGSGRVLCVNARGQSLKHIFSPAPDDVEVLGPSGERLTPDQLPLARAIRGERIFDLIVHWREAHGFRTYSIGIDGYRPDGHDLRFIIAHDVSVVRDAMPVRPEARLSHDEFLSIAAHELRSPIAALQLLLQRMKLQAARSTKLDLGEATSSIERGLRQISRLTMLVQNLLDVSRMRTRRFQLDVEEFDLCAAVHEIVDNAREQALRVGSTLDIEACESLVGSWDRTRIEQVVNNLLANAIKYGRGSPLHLAVHARGESVELSFRDGGIGVPLEDQARIFEPFERAASAHRSQSLGLGLYIVREIVHAHGGRIQIESQPGVGSTFTIVLPRFTSTRASTPPSPDGADSEGRAGEWHPSSLVS